MTKKRGKEHTTLTETAQEVVDVLRHVSGIKMIAPGIINQNMRGNKGSRFLTIVRTSAGFELIITGQGVQKVAVHTENKKEADVVIEGLKNSKKLKNFLVKERNRIPGI